MKLNTKELFTDNFVSAKTVYPSLEELLSASGYPEQELMSLDNEGFDNFLLYNTNYDNLSDFRRAAALYHVVESRSID